jgi:hypothetical protein
MHVGNITRDFLEAVPRVRGARGAWTDEEGPLGLAGNRDFLLLTVVSLLVQLAHCQSFSTQEHFCF